MSRLISWFISHLLFNIICVSEEVKRQYRKELASLGGGRTFLQGGVLDLGRGRKPQRSSLCRDRGLAGSLLYL